MFGMSALRHSLYAHAVAALIALNLMRYTGGGDGSVAPAGQAPSAPLDLPDLTFSTALDPGAAPVRDLFQRAEPVAAAPPPPPPPRPDPAPSPRPDPRAEALAAANARLNRISVVGIFSSGDGMIAVLDNAGDVDNVRAGDELFRGFTVTGVTIDGIVVENRAIGLKRNLTLGGAGAN